MSEALAITARRRRHHNPPPPSRPGAGRRFLLALLLVLGAARAGAASSVTSLMPPTCLPGIGFPFTNTATPAGFVVVYAVEDEVPAGWTADQISHGGVFDAAHRKIKWGPFFDQSMRQLTCRVTPAAQASGIATFSGTGSFDGVAQAITGVRQITVTGVAVANTVVCAMPADFLPGIGFTVTNQVQPAPNVSAHSVEDQVPAGWAVSLVDQGGVFDAAQRKVKWGPFFDHVPRALTYRLTPPTNAVVEVVLTGTGSFDGTAVAITGQRELRPVTSTIVCSLPATFQPGVALGVSLVVTPAPAVAAFAVQDQVPPDWTAGGISDGGLFDAATRTVKWGPFFTNSPRVLSYLATPPAAAAGSVTFVGQGSFNGVAVPVTGQRTTALTASQVTRTLPSTFLPGVPFGVSLQVNPAVNVAAHAVEETVPAGWTVSAINEGGVWDAPHRKVKWGPFFDQAPRTLMFQVTPPLGAAGGHVFDGAGSFDGFAVVTLGPRQTIGLPPADANAIVRLAPETMRAGTSVWVTNVVATAENVFVYALEEFIAPGLVVSNFTGGTWDAANRKIKWGPFFDNLPRRFAYRLIAPTNTSGRFPLNGVGSFDGLPAAIGGATEVLVIANHPPQAGPDSLVRNAGESVFVTAADLLANDTDSDGDPLTFAGVSPLSAHGATLVLTNGGVLYLPPPGFNEPDSFLYTVRDNQGGITAGTVTVTVRTIDPGLRVIETQRPTNGVARVVFRGQPGRTYVVQSTDDLGIAGSTWVPRATRVADAGGNFEFTDNTATNHHRFYRSATTP